MHCSADLQVGDITGNRNPRLQLLLLSDFLTLLFRAFIIIAGIF